jgi:hypothetical protein
MPTDKRSEIESALKSFVSGDLTKNSLTLFETLGYTTDRRAPLTQTTKEAFKEVFVEQGTKFNESRALFDNWKYVDLLFQLTANELAPGLFKDFQGVKYDGRDKVIMESYLFFVIGLSEDQYTRAELSTITREINNLFKIPVMILFQFSNSLTLSIINRRLNKLDENKDVLRKVTLIKDINIASPHRAHIEILNELSFNKLQPRFSIENFVQLHNAWGEVLDTKELNNLFYEDLQEWFYWAIKEIKLPIIPQYITKEECTKNFLVRMLARTIFCWFLKEKGLIKEDLLEIIDHRGKRYPLTSDFEERDFLSTNSYYRGVLQNIFYNALNNPDKSSPKDFKWKKYLHKQFPYEWLISIPYLNGGIFDELKEEDNAKESIEDDVLSVPNSLFYGNRQHLGLNQILNKYKFTIEENTPLEEIVALDPELLGHVFENLLAELDPKLEENTIKSIRKMTGAYYTPRKVIQEMVNESLQLFITKHFERAKSITPDIKNHIHELIFKGSTDSFDDKFCAGVVEAIDQCKVLDPACGSGAFPMGMLHRMVDILKVVDPDNSR